MIRRIWHVFRLSLPTLALSLGCGPALAQQTWTTHAEVAATRAQSPLPRDVIAFKSRRDQCDHLRGEDPGDDEAAAARLERALERTCKGTDAGLAALRQRYAMDPRIMAALSGYEDQVE